MIEKKCLVDIPSRRVYIQRKKGIEYVFYRVEFYKNSDNKSRSKSRSIGIRDPETNRMWPNKTYFELFGNITDELDFNNSDIDQCKSKCDVSSKTDISSSIKFRDVFNIGYSAVIDQCFADLSLDKIITDTFNYDIFKKIKILCAYIIMEGSVMSYIDNFSEKMLFSDMKKVISSQRVSEIFNEISTYDDYDFIKNG